MADQALQAQFDTIRIPLLEQETNDVTAAGSQSTEALFQNCFANTNKETGTRTVTKRQGITYTNQNLLTTFSSGENISCVDAVIITAVGDADVGVAAFYDSTNSKHVIVGFPSDVKIGEITGTDEADDVFLTEIVVAGVPGVAVAYANTTGTTTRGYYAMTSAGAFAASSLTQITDGDFPSELGTPDPIIGRFVQMNGTTYIMSRSGKIYNSDLNSISSWTGSAIVLVQMNPDIGRGLMRYKHHVVAFGANSIEFYNDIGATPSPLQVQQQAFIKEGLVFARSIVNINDTIYWLGRGIDGFMGLWKLDQYTPTKVSNPFTDDHLIRYIDLTSPGSYGRIIPLRMKGKLHLLFPGAVLANAAFTATYNTLAYCVDEDMWWLYNNNLSSYTASNIKYAALVPMTIQTMGQYTDFCYVIYTNIAQSFYNDPSCKYLFAINQSCTDSDVNNTAVAYYCAVQLTPKSFGNLKRKFIHKLSLVYQIPTVADVIDVTLRVSKQDYQDYSNLITRTMTLGSAIPRTYCTRLGSSRKWGFIIEYLSAQDEVNLEAIELDISQGTH